MNSPLVSLLGHSGSWKFRRTIAAPEHKLFGRVHESGAVRRVSMRLWLKMQPSRRVPAFRADFVVAYQCWSSKPMPVITDPVFYSKGYYLHLYPCLAPRWQEIPNCKMEACDHSRKRALRPPHGLVCLPWSCPYRWDLWVRVCDLQNSVCTQSAPFVMCLVVKMEAVRLMRIKCLFFCRMAPAGCGIFVMAWSVAQGGNDWLDDYALPFGGTVATFPHIFVFLLFSPIFFATNLFLQLDSSNFYICNFITTIQHKLRVLLTLLDLN